MLFVYCCVCRPLPEHKTHAHTQNTKNTHPCTNATQDTLFEPGTFVAQSRHHNLIAFAVDASLMLKVLRSAAGAPVERLEAKLLQKAVPVPGQDEPEQRPFMSFTARVRVDALCVAGSVVVSRGGAERGRGICVHMCSFCAGANSKQQTNLNAAHTQHAPSPPPFQKQGSSVTIVQDLPISKPFVPSEIDRVAAAKAVRSYAPLYLDLLSGGARLPALIERLKAVGAVLALATCKVRGGVVVVARCWDVLVVMWAGSACLLLCLLAPPRRILPLELTCLRTFLPPAGCTAHKHIETQTHPNTQTQNGDLHLRVSATNVALGTQLQGLTVMPASEPRDDGGGDEDACCAAFDCLDCSCLASPL